MDFLFLINFITFPEREKRIQIDSGRIGRGVHGQKDYPTLGVEIQ